MNIHPTNVWNDLIAAGFNCLPWWTHILAMHALALESNP